MTGSGSFLGYALLMLAAGLGIPIMATLNGGLGVRLQSPIMATTILFVMGLVISIAYGIATKGFPKSIPDDIPIYLYFGGIFVVFYILSITWVAPNSA